MAAARARAPGPVWPLCCAPYVAALWDSAPLNRRLRLQGNAPGDQLGIQDGAKRDEADALLNCRLQMPVFSSPSSPGEVGGGPGRTAAAAVGQAQLTRGEESALSVKVCYSDREISFPDHKRHVKGWNETTFDSVIKVIRESLSLPESVSKPLPMLVTSANHTHMMLTVICVQRQLAIYTSGMRQVTSTDLSDVAPFQPGVIRLMVGLDGAGNISTLLEGCSTGWP